MVSTKYPNLDVDDLIGVICRFYPDHVIEDHIWDFKAGKIREDTVSFDGLAHFLVREMKEVYDSGLSPLEQLHSLIDAFNMAINDVQTVVDGLYEYTLDWATL